MALKKKKDSWPRVYIGPVRKDGLLTCMQVFAADYPPAVKQLLDATPGLQQFFIPVSEVNAAMRELRTAGSQLNVNFIRMTRTLGGL
jgi:hypothetical protein